MQEEWLDIVDEQGNPTGEIVERGEAHAKGIRHRTAHVWILREREGQTEVLLQKRSDQKDSHPGCYDISSAGHIPAGVDYQESALRELEEELGLSVRGEELIYCGQRQVHWKDNFHGKPFFDEQVSNVYCIWRDVEPEELRLQESEVSEVRWMPLKACKEGVKNHRFPNCIMPEELELLPGGKICH